MNNLHIITYKLHNKPYCESRSSCGVCRAVLFDKLDTAKVHALDTSNVSSRVVSRRDEASGIVAIHVVRRQVPTSVLVFQSLIVALVLSRLDYCNSVLFGLPANLSQRLQSVQNAATRLIFLEFDGQNTLPQRSSAFTGCASQNVSPSN